MKSFLLVVLTVACSAATAQVAPAPTKAPAELSIRDQIKAQRAKEQLDERNGPSQRAWDRDANGKRPWDRVKGQ
jgi:hypothetical protein